MNKKRLIKLLGESNAIKYGNFTLSSGKKSSYYIDLKKAYTKPDVLKEIVRAIIPLIKKIRYDRLAGMELGAVPIISVLSIETKKPFIIVRKGIKGHGTSKRFEGSIKKGDVVIVIEDVSTTGNTILEVAELLRGEGGIIKHAISVVDRGEGAVRTLRDAGVVLEPIISATDIQ